MDYLSFAARRLTSTIYSGVCNPLEFILPNFLATQGPLM
jgi:hypothetical protein